jgi:protein-S-isoprenylcysteine O-methyltransferase Ste14
MEILKIRALVRLFGLSLLMEALLFVPAGTLDYWQAWVFLATYLSASLAITLYLVKNDPKLLARRMKGGPIAETLRVQKIIMSFASVVFVSLLVVPALDHRFAWSSMPPLLAVAGDGMVLLGWLGIFFVFKENTFTSATIELAADHRVIATGPYSVVRHPMYSGGLILLLGTPIALGSWWGVLVMASIVPALIFRLFDEETFLARQLPGYLAYQKKVPYRLVPLIW